LQKNIEFQEKASNQEISTGGGGLAAARVPPPAAPERVAPQEIQAAKAEVDQTLADIEKRKADMDRAQKLHQNQFISTQEMDAARTAHEIALANHRKAKEYYALAVEGPGRRN